MSAVIIGVVFLGFAVYSVLPQDWALQWWPHVLVFLKGGLPVLSLLIGCVAVLIGAADIRDRNEEKQKKNNIDPNASDNSVSIDNEEK